MHDDDDGSDNATQRHYFPDSVKPKYYCTSSLI